MTPRLIRVAVVTFCVLLPFRVQAQDRPVVFLHGLGAEAGDWASTASRLSTTVALEAHSPELPWKEPYEVQGQSLQFQEEYLALPWQTVAVGHSNGGVVARQWSRQHPLGGIVTIGTPHKGIPFIQSFTIWEAIHSFTPILLNRVLAAFSQSSNVTWVYQFFANALGWVSDYSVWSVVGFLVSGGLQLNVPVAGEMAQGSAYLDDLNSWGNLAREAGEVQARVGIVSIAHNFYFAGPARATVPEYADAIAGVLYGTAYGLQAWGSYILATASFDDVAAIEQGFSLLDLAGHLLSIDPMYCRMLTSRDLSRCEPNDGIVSISSQTYPGAPNLMIGGDNDGPAHKQEKDRGEDALYQALVWYAHVPPRQSGGSTTPPGGGNTPSDPSDPGSGGSGSPGGTLQSTGEDVLSNGERILPFQDVNSQNGRFHLEYQGDGNLVLFDENWQALWTTCTDGIEPGSVDMQGDGNLVIYDAQNAAVWASGTHGHDNAFLVVQNDGNLVIYDASGQALWASGTNE